MENKDLPTIRLKKVDAQNGTSAGARPGSQRGGGPITNRAVGSSRNRVEGQNPARRPERRPRPPQKKRKQGMPVWGQVLLVFALLFGSLFVGLIAGYSIVGKEPISEIFDSSTWKHVFELIFG